MARSGSRIPPLSRAKRRGTGKIGCVVKWSLSRFSAMTAGMMQISRDCCDAGRRLPDRASRLGAVLVFCAFWTVAFGLSSAATPLGLTALESPVSHQKYQDAAPLLRDYLKDYPSSARGHYDLGYALFRTHQIAESVSELSAPLKLDVSNAEVHKILALDCNIVPAGFRPFT
jgi:Tetratricopeptide repeat